MIVLEVDVNCVLAVEGKCHPQIAGDGYRPAIPLIASHCVKAPTRNVHVLRPDGGIQAVQHAFDSRTPGRGNALR